MKSQSKYQRSVQVELIKIAGRPHKIYDLTHIGKDIRVWIWKVNNKSEKKNLTAIFALADKAKELDCEVYFLKYNRKATSEILNPESIDQTNELTVWCKKESI